MFITEQDLKDINVDKANEILQRVCSKAVEDALRALPAVMENLLQQGALLKKTSEQFYKDHADLQDHKDIVAMTLEELDGKNPGRQYIDTLRDAVPLIREKIKRLEAVDFGAKKPTLASLDERVNGDL